MTLSTSPLTGTRDFFPEEMSVRSQVFAKLYAAVESFGYVRYDGPMLEPLELYAAKSSEEIVSQQTYRMKDRGDRELVVRPEMTPTVARMIAAKASQLSFPARWYSHPNLWRYERKQRGRYREHWQVNVDLFGTESWEAEAEMFELCGEMMFALGAAPADFIVRVNDRKLAQAILGRAAGLPEENRDEKIRAIFGALDQFHKLPVDKTKEQLAALGIAAANVDEVIAAVRAPAAEYLALAPPELVEKSAIARVLKEGLTTSKPLTLVLDPLVIRGFDYYTSTVFEIYDTNPENPRSIAGGGRYDNLVGLFGKARVPGIGFGMGDVTLIDFLETHALAPRPRIGADAQVMAIGNDVDSRKRVHEIALALRADGLRVVTALEPKKLGKLLEKAAKEGVRFAVITGPDEAARGAVKLRDLSRSEEWEVQRRDLSTRIALGLAEHGATAHLPASDDDAP